MSPGRTTWVGRRRFASKLEARRYVQLALMVKGGVISLLELQPEFVLAKDIRSPITGKKVTVKYHADFAYTENGKRVVEEVKGRWGEADTLRVKWFVSLNPGIDLRVLKTEDVG